MALLMAVGILIRKAGVINRPDMKKIDRVSFFLFMPMLLFKNIYELDDLRQVSIRIIIFALSGLFILFLSGLAVLKKMKIDHNKAASLGQAIVRTNYILFGLAIGESIYGTGNAGLVALMATIVVPCTNAFAVVILEMNRSGQAGIRKIIFSIFKNPMVLAALTALLFKISGLTIPELIYGVVEDIASVTTPLAFISLGVSLDIGEAEHNIRPLSFYIVFRMLLVPVIILGLSVLLGFRGQELCVMMVIFSAPAAVASYPMAVTMGADGDLAGQLVCVSTLVSVLTLFCTTFTFQSLGFL